MAAPLAPSLLFLGEIASTLSDVGFSIQVLVFAYLLYWLFVTFNRVPVLFGVSALLAAYFLFAFTWSVVGLTAVFLFFFVAGNQLQMILQFGLGPMLSIFGVHDISGQTELQKAQQEYVQQKFAHAPGSLSPQEAELMSQIQQQAEASGVDVNARRRMGLM